MTHGKTYNKSPRRINHKATKSKTNTGTTALERSVEQTTRGFGAIAPSSISVLGMNGIPFWNTGKRRIVLDMTYLVRTY